MGMSRRARDRQVLPVRSANERLKERWSLCLAWSVTTATAAHLALFAALTGRELSWTPTPQLTIAQLVPIASPRTPPDPREHSPEERPNPLEVEPPREVVAADPWAAFELPLPSLANLALTDEDLESTQTGMILEPVSVVGPKVGPMVPAFTWPQLRNPRSVVRFLRRSYNPVALEAVPERFVSVAMSINEKGVVEWCELHESSGHPAVDQLALAVIREVAEFMPASRRGVPIPVVVVLSIPFEMPW